MTTETQELYETCKCLQQDLCHMPTYTVLLCYRAYSQLQVGVIWAQGCRYSAVHLLSATCIRMHATRMLEVPSICGNLLYYSKSVVRYRNGVLLKKCCTDRFQISAKVTPHLASCVHVLCPKQVKQLV